MATVPHGATGHLRFNLITLWLLATGLDSATLGHSTDLQKCEGNKLYHGRARHQQSPGRRTKQKTVSSTSKLQWLKRRETEGNL